MNPLIKISTYEVRNGIFHGLSRAIPLRKPKTVFYDEKSGLRVDLRNKHLGQNHKDLLDFFWMNKGAYSNTFALRFNESFLLKQIKISRSGRSVQLLRQKILDLIDTNIHIITPKKEYVFGIIKYYEKDINGDYIIIFDENYVAFMNENEHYFCDKVIIKKIIDEENAFIKAVLRFAFSHEFVNIDAQKLLDIFIGNENESQKRAQRRARKELEIFCEKSNFAGLKITKNGYLQKQKKRTKSTHMSKTPRSPK
jgi:hypothetical protein